MVGPAVDTHNLGALCHGKATTDRSAPKENPIRYLQERNRCTVTAVYLSPKSAKVGRNWPFTNGNNCNILY